MSRERGMLNCIVQSKTREVRGGGEKEFERVLLAQNVHAPRPPPAANG